MQSPLLSLEGRLETKKSTRMVLLQAIIEVKDILEATIAMVDLPLLAEEATASTVEGKAISLVTASQGRII